MKSIMMFTKDKKSKKNGEEEKDNKCFRFLPGILGLLQRVVLLSIPIIGILFILNVHMYLKLYIYTEQYIGLFLALVFAGFFLSTPASKRSPRNNLPWYDVLLVMAGLSAGLYIMFYYPQVARGLGQLTIERVVLGCMMILLILEGIRRFAGWVLVSVIAFFICYGCFAVYFPSPLQGLPVSWERLVTYIYLDPNSMLNLINLAAGIALSFIVFGQYMISFGGGNHLTNIALTIFGRYRGGAAKAAVVGSSLLGTLSGGSMSNVLISGSVTIPLMIRSGYKPAMAGAVESVASSGGNIMPPVLGVAAFLMAEYLSISYASVAIAAIVPALLFYAIFFIQVDLHAAKEGLRGLPVTEILKAKKNLHEAWVVLPCILVLVYLLMVVRLSPSTAGVVASFIAVPVLLIAKSSRKGFLKRLLSALENASRMLLNISIIICGAGIIVGIANSSGLGYNLAYLLVSLGGGNLLLLLILAAASSIILGMGMPSVPAYVLVATLIAPALEQLGVVPLAAHMFIFYFAMVSNFTPPVALACFAASTISGANPNQTGFYAMRLGILAYILPFLFVYSPALLLLSNSLLVIILSMITAILGTFSLGIGLVGYFYQPVPLIRRLLFAIGGIALLVPFQEPITNSCIFLSGFGLLLTIILLLFEAKINKISSNLQVCK